MKYFKNVIVLIAGFGLGVLYDQNTQPFDKYKNIQYLAEASKDTLGTGTNGYYNGDITENYITEEDNSENHTLLTKNTKTPKHKQPNIIGDMPEVSEFEKLSITPENVAYIKSFISKKDDQLDTAKRQFVERLMNKAKDIERDDVETLAEVLSMASSFNDGVDSKVPAEIVTQSIETLNYRYDVPLNTRIKLLSALRGSITPENYEALLTLPVNYSNNSFSTETAVIANLILTSESENPLVRIKALKQIINSEGFPLILANKIKGKLDSGS